MTFARRGDTAETLAARYLGSAAKAWRIEAYSGARTFTEGQEVVIPKRDWNPGGITPAGYQLVPVLVYHDIGAQPKGRLQIAARQRLIDHHYGQGVRLSREEKLREAVKEWRTVLELDPQHANARRNIEQAERLLKGLEERRRK